MANRYDDFEMDENGKLIIGVSKPGAQPLIDVTGGQRPVVDALTIDASRPGEFRNYTQETPRMPGGFGERVRIAPVATDNIMGADRSLMQRGAGGLRIVDQGMPEGGFGMRREAAGVSGDGRIVLSPEAIAGLGRTQLEEEQAAQAMQRTRINPAAPIIAKAQAQADQGFLPAGTDVMRKQQMRRTLIDARGDWQDNNRPRDIMTRRNTADQIMTQADASRMTPQVMTQDGVATGWDPISQKIVTDSSGARAMGASRTKDTSLDAEDDKTIADEVAKLNLRKNGKLTEQQAFWYGNMMKTDPKQAEEYKASLIGKWSDEDEQIFSRYKEQATKRGIIRQAAPAAASGSEKVLGGRKAR
jgi:hypothetical protein